MPKWILFLSEYPPVVKLGVRKYSKCSKLRKIFPRDWTYAEEPAQLAVFARGLPRGVAMTTSDILTGSLSAIHRIPPTATNTPPLDSSANATDGQK